MLLIILHGLEVEINNNLKTSFFLNYLRCVLNVF